MTMRRFFCRVLSAAIVASALPTVALAAPQASSLIIATGSVTGVYYPAGGAVCRLINKTTGPLKLRCSVQATSGSIYNLQALRAHKVNLAVVQSDAQMAALKGQGEFVPAGADSELRSLFGLYAEPLTIVARQDANIQQLDDLPGKRVDIGNPGSGDRSTMDILMRSQAWDLKTFSEISELKGAERAQALCDNKIDAFVYVVGHPSGTIKEASSSCDISLVEISGVGVDKLLSAHPEYSKTVIPGRLYRGADQDIPSFGVSATLVTTSQLPEDIAYQLVKAVFDNFEQFKRLHPAFSQLNKQQMVSQGLSAPLHPGAKRYFIEAGLLK
ncbi:TAXI family TRAP transporter solute-binding subunit [Pseudaeromonas pectinilytica]